MGALLSFKVLTQSRFSSVVVVPVAAPLYRESTQKQLCRAAADACAWNALLEWWSFPASANFRSRGGFGDAPP